MSRAQHPAVYSGDVGFGGKGAGHRTSAAAIRDNRPGEAEDALRYANSAAVAMGREFAPRDDFLQAFGPATVALKRAENAMIVDKPDLVLKLSARTLTGGMRPTSNNRNRHLSARTLA